MLSDLRLVALVLTRRVDVYLQKSIRNIYILKQAQKLLCENSNLAFIPILDSSF